MCVIAQKSFKVKSIRENSIKIHFSLFSFLFRREPGHCAAPFSCRKRQQRMTRQGQNEKPVRSASPKGSIFLPLCYNKAETCSTGADKKKAQTPGAPGHNKKCAYRLHAGRIQIGICRAVRTGHSEPVLRLVWESPSNYRRPIVIQAVLSCRFPVSIHEE